MNIKEFVILYLFYFTIPFRMIAILLTYFIAVLIGYICANKKLDQNLLHYSNKFIMKLLSINPIYDVENIESYNRHINSNEKFIVVFNHSSLIEPFLILSLFKNVSYLLSPGLPAYIPFFNIIYKKFNYIYIEKNKTTQQIIDFTNNREKGSGALFIAPGEGRVSDDPDENMISKFRSGAFVGKFPILPIIIKFENNLLDFNFEKGENVLHFIFKMFLKNNHNVKVKVLDMVYPQKEDTVDTFKTNVFNIMSEEFKIL